MDVVRELPGDEDSADLDFPFPAYPERGEFLLCGSLRVHGWMFWVTGAGDPDSWPLVLADDKYEHWERFDGPLCEFLTELALGRFDASASGMITAGRVSSGSTSRRARCSVRDPPDLNRPAFPSPVSPARPSQPRPARRPSPPAILPPSAAIRNLPACARRRPASCPPPDPARRPSPALRPTRAIVMSSRVSGGVRPARHATSTSEAGLASTWDSSQHRTQVVAVLWACALTALAY